MLSVEKIVIEGFGLHKKESAFIYTTIRDYSPMEITVIIHTQVQPSLLQAFRLELR